MNSNKENFKKDTDGLNNLNEPVTSYLNREQTISETEEEINKKIISYWRMLSSDKKEFVLELMKSFVDEEEPIQISKEQWAILMKEREEFIGGVAKTYNWSQVREMMHDKSKRDDVRN